MQKSAAALVGGEVITAYAKYVYAFDAVTGAELWRSTATTKNVLGSPAVAGASGNQVVMIGDLSGREYAFQVSNGALLDKFDSGIQERVLGVHSHFRWHGVQRGHGRQSLRGRLDRGRSAYRRVYAKCRDVPEDVTAIAVIV